MTNLSKLFAKRAAIQAKIDAVMANGFSAANPSKPATKRGRPAKTATVKVSKKAVKAAVNHKRAKNEKPLHAHITEALNGSAGLPVKEIVAAVLKNGFHTSNKDGLYAQVSVALGNETKFSKVSRGVYVNATATPVVEVAPVVVPVVETTVSTETPTA